MRKVPRRLPSGEGTNPVLIDFVLVGFVLFSLWEIQVWNIFEKHLASFYGYM